MARAENMLGACLSVEDKRYYSGYVAGLKRIYSPGEISDEQDGMIRDTTGADNLRMAYTQGYLRAHVFSKMIDGKKSLMGNAIIPSFRISEELKKKLEDDGVKRGKTVSGIIRELIAERYRNVAAPPAEQAIGRPTLDRPALDTNLFGDDPEPEPNIDEEPPPGAVVTPWNPPNA